MQRINSKTSSLLADNSKMSQRDKTGEQQDRGEFIHEYSYNTANMLVRESRDTGAGRLDTAYAYYKEGDTAQSIAALDRFTKAYPNHPNLDYALYLKALANFKEDLGPIAGVLGGQDLADRDPKAARESFEMFKELIRRYPDSRYSQDALARMDVLVDGLARHELHVARYYFKRGAWLSAVNRAQDVIVRFPNSPARREALDIMVECYDRMGMADLRDDAKRVLAKNYPTDPLSGEGRNRSSWWKFW